MIQMSLNHRVEIFGNIRTFDRAEKETGDA